LKRQLLRLLPFSTKLALRRIYYFPNDLVDRLKGRDSLTPPQGMIYIGTGDFKEIGDNFKHYFIELANLQPNERVLDLGCGIGRMAVPLTNYLTQEGEYWGFDIVNKWIAWCKKHISSRFGNFHFQYVDLYNKIYNPKAKVKAIDFRFPFSDDYFDFVFLTSVFTHMLPSDLEHYLSEVSRVLKQGGRCLITFFLLNDESRHLIRTGRSNFDFKHKIEGCLTVDANEPEFALAYNENIVRGLFARYQLQIIEPIHFGSWCERATFLDFQDIIVAEKTASN